MENFTPGASLLGGMLIGLSASAILFFNGGVHIILSRFILHRPAPFFASAFAVPTRNDIDPKLIGGAALFGAGWGLGGFCPGPALTSVATGSVTVLIFIGAMMAGMLLFKLVENVGTQQTVRPTIAGSIVDV